MRKALRLAVHVAFVCFACLVLFTGCRGGRLPEQRVSRGVYHQVQRGQTLWGIARKYGVDMKTLARVNQLSDADVLQVGQRLHIPGATRRRQVAGQCPCRTKEAVTVRKRGSSAARPPLFTWPVRGTVTRGFKQNGKHRHDGIDIAARRGTPIQVVADGKVIYSDWGPGGYGRLVIVRHKADMVTVYAHNYRNLVRVGQAVRRGDPIATVGKSGRATGYHLHFEVRRKTVPVPPANYLSRSRQLVRLDQR